MSTGAMVAAEIERARDVTQRARLLDARGSALRVVRLLEERLRVALDGDPLRGAPKLVPVGDFRGYNVRSKSAHRHFTWIAREGESLVLGRSGALLMAQRAPEAEQEVTYRPALDGELFPADLALVVSAAVEACRRHVEHSERTLTTRAEVGALAVRMARALGG